MYTRWIKRGLDFILGITALVVCAPLLLLVGVLVRMMLGAPVVFRQQRPGLHEQTFTCLKFRTMADKRDAQGALLREQERIVPFGAWLRRTSLDELPQLWNIVRGDLSLVGPRPMLMEFLPYYTPEERRRHSVRPGLTGWAQVHGRNHLDFDERLKMDVWYVDHLSWHLDLRILLATVQLVMSAKGTGFITYPLLHEQRRNAAQLSDVVAAAGSANGVEDDPFGETVA